MVSYDGTMTNVNNKKKRDVENLFALASDN